MRHYVWVFLWAAIVLILFNMPASSADRVPRFEGIDKLVHTGVFFVFTVLLFHAAISRQRMTRFSWRIAINVVFVSGLFALLTEFLQWKVFTYRSAELWDLFANAVGIGMGIFAYILFVTIVEKVKLKLQK